MDQEIGADLRRRGMPGSDSRSATDRARTWQRRQAFRRTLQKIFLPAFKNEYLSRLDDQAVLPIEGARVAFTTDAFVVTPIFFPGGNIGDLAINGTVNDLAMSGAKPLYIAAAFILEEGLATADLERVVGSMSAAARMLRRAAGHRRYQSRQPRQGRQDLHHYHGMGLVDSTSRISADRARPGDKILLSGTVGDHGMAIMSQRENLEFESAIESDTAALHTLVAAMLEPASEIHCLSDPTRGGVATT